jgi:hypothetical protein
MSDRWVNGLQQDSEELERRNQKHLDRLMELFKNNTSEALKYVIHFDNEMVSRGNVWGQLTLSKRWMEFSLFGGGAKGVAEVLFCRIAPTVSYIPST